MRFAIMIAAFGVVAGVSAFVPSMTPAAYAQTVDAAQIALEAELVAAAGDPAALDAILAREQAAGNTNRLARAMAGASRTLAVTDVAAAAALIIKAVSVAESGDSGAQDAVGSAASAVATTAASRGEAAVSANVTTAVAVSGATSIAIGYVNAGGSAGTGIPQGQQQTPQTQEVQPPVEPGPDAPDTPVLPVIVEPNPAQTGSPT
ncbi:hypothetical protein [Kordiimonas sp.]|uniref:hypothetical protein n=1 Tax=Kordiimonas sp. TaxID=1970157 RepID=UPI003A8F1F49